MTAHGPQVLHIPLSHALEQVGERFEIRDGYCQAFCTGLIVLKYLRARLDKTRAAVELFPRQIPCQQNVHAVDPDVTPIQSTDNVCLCAGWAVDSDARIWSGLHVYI